MANFVEAKLSGDFTEDLSRFEKSVQEKILYAGAAEMASIVADEVRLNASPPRLGRKTGNLQNSIYWAFSPEKSTPTQKTYRISWNKRKAPHGHLIEFGTSRAPAYPFVRPAFDRIGSAINRGLALMRKRMSEL